MKRSGSNKDEHDDLIREMIEEFESEGYENIEADLDGNRPDKINGRIPDIIAEKDDGTLIILEVETCESIDDSHTEQQWRDFYEYVQEEEAEFHIAVPDGCEDDVKARLDELNIPSDKVTIWTSE